MPAVRCSGDHGDHSAKSPVCALGPGQARVQAATDAHHTHPCIIATRGRGGGEELVRTATFFLFVRCSYSKACFPHFVFSFPGEFSPPLLLLLPAREVCPGIIHANYRPVLCCYDVVVFFFPHMLTSVLDVC